MSAPKGNNYWEFRNKHGRNHKYTPDLLWDEAVKYFVWISAKVWNKKRSYKKRRFSRQNNGCADTNTYEYSVFLLVCRY